MLENIHETNCCSQSQRATNASERSNAKKTFTTFYFSLHVTTALKVLQELQNLCHNGIKSFCKDSTKVKR